MNNAIHMGQAQKRYLRNWLILLPLIAVACGVNLSGEPDVVATLAPRDPPTATPVEESGSFVVGAADEAVGYPLRAPDLLLGAELYANHCSDCHGLDGAGDGPLVESGELPTHLPDFIAPTTLGPQSPLDVFTTITEGRLENLMPPWEEALSVEERWDVGLFAYTLAYHPEDIARGEQLYAQNCAACHGAAGHGDGPRAAEINRPIPDLTLQSKIVTLSDTQLLDVVTDGVDPAMPAFAEQLDEDERRAVVTFVRTLGLESPAIIENRARARPVATEEVAAPSAATQVAAVATTTPLPLATFSGRITNGTADASVPPNMAVTLRAFDADFNETTFETESDFAGNYELPDIPLDPARQYIVTVEHAGRTFASDLFAGANQTSEIDAPITLFELTDNADVIKITGAAIQITPIEAGIQVLQVLNFRNDSDRLFTTDEMTPDGRFISLQLELPLGAILIGFPSSVQRYAVLQQNRIVVDTAPIRPGEDHLFQVIYAISFASELLSIEQPLDYQVDGEVRLLLPPEVLTASSEQLPLIGPETLGTATFISYGNNLNLPPGDAIRFDLRTTSDVISFAERPDNVVTSNNLLPVILVIIGGGFVVAGVALYGGSRSSKARAQQEEGHIDNLVRQIAELDAQHERGEINHDLYHQQRTQRKAWLAALMGDAEPNE